MVQGKRFLARFMAAKTVNQSSEISVFIFLQYDKNEKGKKRNLAEKTESKKASPFLVSFLICLLGERLTYLFTNVRIEAP